MSSSEFEDVDLDEDDIRQLELAEREHAQQASSSSVRPSPNSNASPSVVQTPTVTSSPGRTLPWKTNFNTRPPSPGLKGRSRRTEPLTHHRLDPHAAKTWVYPLNVPLRLYQFNIVKQALFDNVLISLPTGLGKTFIAAAVMYNFYRWFPKSKIMFLAPTKPLVTQQVEACFKLCGVPYSDTAELTGSVAKVLRTTAYAERRVFYMTPQTLENDIRTGLCDPRDIVCLVVDEAHRTQGGYAYGNCVALIRKANTSFRVLALSATPGSTVEGVQAVIDALGIARTETRTDDSMDVKEYVRQRKTEEIILPLGPQIEEFRDLLAKVIEVYLDKVAILNDFRLRDPLTISNYSIQQVQQSFLGSGSANNTGLKFKILGALAVLRPLALAMNLLVLHGIIPCHSKLLQTRTEFESQGNNLKKSLLSNHDFQHLMTQLDLFAASDSIGHPKLERTIALIMDHLVMMSDQSQDTRIMVFVKFRDSASEIVRQLNKHRPMIKPTVFVGQAAAKGTNGMSQKEQREVRLPAEIH
jgi:ATP-dependent DNA helicase MPH1